jgi:hypothetical protein
MIMSPLKSHSKVLGIEPMTFCSVGGRDGRPVALFLPESFSSIAKTQPNCTFGTGKKRR